jgi:hypothetical protein
MVAGALATDNEAQDPLTGAANQFTAKMYYVSKLK